LLKNTAILIFGAGLNQLELIREARVLGITSVVIDPQIDPPGRLEADYFYCVDGNDYERTRGIALKHRVSGIVTGQMEKPLSLMARLAYAQGFIFNSPEVTKKCIDKWLMKKSFLESNVPFAKGMLISKHATISRELLSELTFPLIVKPRDSFSSRGVFRCETLDELVSNLVISQQYSTGGDVIVEEFLNGKEYSAESITYNGNKTIVQFTAKYITNYPTTVETGHFQPANLTTQERDAAIDLVYNAIRALGIENSASHAEFMITDKGPVMIELGARLGGDFIGSYLTRASTGVSLDRAAIQVALGLSPDLIVKCEKYSMIKYLELPAGKIVNEVLPIDEIYSIRGLIFAHVFVKPGDKIMPLTHSGQRSGCCIIEGESTDAVNNTISQSMDFLRSKIHLI